MLVPYSSLCKVINTRASFPNDEAAFKLLFLALCIVAKRWTMLVSHWSRAMQAFATFYEGSGPTLDGNSITQHI